MAPIWRAVDRARITWRAVQLADGALRVFLLTGAAAVAGFMLDNLVHLPQGVRLVWGVGILLAAIAGIGRYMLYPLARPINDRMVAVHLERALPELDNRLINAVLLSDERFGHRLTRVMADLQIAEAAGQLDLRALIRPVDLESLALWGKRVLVLVGVLVVYGLLFGDYLANGWDRFVHPLSWVPPITDTRLEVTPGSAVVLLGEPLDVEARISGVLPQEARVKVREDGADWVEDIMAFRGNAFRYHFPGVHRPFSYRIEAGDAVSRPYRVQLRERPRVTDLEVTYEYPGYTGLGHRKAEGSGGNLRAPQGTTARLRAVTDVPVSTGAIRVLTPNGRAGDRPLTRLEPRALQGELVIKQNGTYEIVVTDARGVSSLPVTGRIDSVADSAPRTRVLEPGRDLSVAPGSRVEVLVEARDDWALRALRIMAQARAGEAWREVHGRECSPGTLTARAGTVFDVGEMGLEVGDTVEYCAVAGDGMERDAEAAGRSRIYRLRVVRAELAGAAEGAVREALRDLIRGLIAMQRDNLADTRSLAEERPQREIFARRAEGLIVAEEAILSSAMSAVDEYAGQTAGATAEALRRITADHINRAVAALKSLRVAPKPYAAPIVDAVARQERVIKLLEALLEDPKATLTQLRAEEGPVAETPERGEELAQGRTLAERLLRGLDEFGDEQRRVIEMSKRLAEKAVDDFTEEDEQQLEQIIDTEKEWTRFFQEAATDLSKLPPQDFSLATQAQEFLEVYSEVQQAVQHGEREVIEMAVPYEQAALELAETIETNIEKWLMETKDDKRWSMEEPLEDYELPMSELPDELQDLIGDLVESEQDMIEEVEDMTSGWFDSLDIGAGWSTEDGPISNMSAKGVTGNRLPNTNEVGGRSGEGRTGKSSGQFVEQTATGKGGRQTPTRLTPDPYEAGFVEDTSAEAPSGATGGGKVSGQGAEGLYGPLPPPLQQRLRRVANKQHELIDKAERLDYGLRKYRAPRAQLPETIELMRQQARALSAGEIANFARVQRVVLANLREVKDLTEKHKQITRDRSPLLPKHVREQIAAARGEDVPELYREMVRNYYRALSEGVSLQDSQ